MALTASPDLQDILARDLAKDIVKRIDGLIKATAAIPRTNGKGIDSRLDIIAGNLLMARTDMECYLAEVDS